MPTIKLTLLIDDDVLEQIKIQAVREKRPLSRLTQELYEEYLKRKAKTR